VKKELKALAVATVIFFGTAQAAYVKRFETIQNGALTFTGNTLGLLKLSGANAQGTNSSSIGTFTTINTALQDILPAPGAGNTAFPFGTTSDWRLNSSLANLVVPPGSTILHAELIWGGSYNVTGEVLNAADLDTPIKFTVPNGTSSSVGFLASTKSTLTNFYIRSADVTALVKAGGAGGYVVTGVPATQSTTENNSNAAGWTLAVAYQNSGLATRNLTIFVGSELTNTSSSSPATVSGFCTPNSATQSGRLLVSALEGDTSGSGDRMKFGPTTASFTDLFGPNNPVGNFFASQINKDDGTLDTSGTFGSRNSVASTNTNVSGARQGWDITNVNVSSTLTSGQTSAVAQGSTTGDQYVINGLGLQIDVGAPKFPTTVKTVDKNVAVVGDVLSYTIRLDNTAGTANADNVVFKDIIPTGTSLVASSFSLDNVVNAGVTASSLASGVNVGVVSAGTVKTVRLKVRVDAIPTPPNAGRYDNAATWTYDFVSCAGQPVTQGFIDTDSTTTGIARIEPSKTVSPAGTVVPNTILTYTILVPNTGAAPTVATTLQDFIPTGTSYVANSTSLNGVTVPDVSGVMPFVTARAVNSPSATAGIINPTETASLSFQVSVNASTTGIVSNTANADIDGTGSQAPIAASVSNTVQTTADLEIQKTASPSPAIVGSGITWRLSVLNNGPSAATGVTVTDTVPVGLANVQWTCAASGTGSSCAAASGVGNINETVTLASGAANKLTYLITAVVGSTAANPLPNTATVTASSSTIDPVASNNSASTSTPLIQPDLTIAKAHIGNFTRGGTGSYSLTVSNLATAATSALVTVTDTLPTGIIPGIATGSGWSCNTVAQAVTCTRLDVLGAGSSYPVISIPVTIAQTAAGGSGTGSQTNTANVSGGGEVNTSNNSASDPTSIVSSSDLSIVKTAPNSIVPGTTATFSLAITNNGLSDAENVVLTDPTPAELTVSSVFGSGCSALPCNLGTIPNGQSRSVSVVYNIPNAYTTPNPVSNTATIASSTPDPKAANNTSTATAPLASKADLGISKTGPSSIIPGTGNSVFTITITNSGPSVAQNVVIADPTPSGITFVSTSGDCTDPFPCNLGNIAVGASRTIFATYSIPASFSASNFTNTATVLSSSLDEVASNNSASLSPNITPRADLSLSKTIVGSVPNLSDNLTYRITLVNAGPNATSNVVVKDQLPTGLSFVSSNPSVGSYNAVTGEWSIAALAVGTQTLDLIATVSTVGAKLNTAEVTASSVLDPDSTPNDGSGDDFSSVSFSPKAPDLAIDKSHAADFVRGTNNTYTIVVTNTGDGFTTAPVTITDTLPAGLTPATPTGTGWTCAAPVGQSISCSRTDVLNAGSSYPSITIPVSVEQSAAGATGASNLANTASISGGGDSTPSNNSNTDPTAIVSSADVAITKSGSVNAVAGQAVSYTQTVTNNGPSDAYGVVVTDPTPVGLIVSSISGSGCSAFPCALGQVKVGETRTITASYNVPSTYTTPDPIINQTSVSSSTPDPTSINNNAQASSSLNAPIADLGISKTDTPPSSTAIPGTQITYTIVITNAGPSAAVNALVQDTLPSTITGVTWTCTASGGSSCPASGTGDINTLVTVLPSGNTTFRLTGTVIASATGNLVNIATVTPPAGVSDPSSNNNADNNTLVPQADLEITKTAPANLVPGTNAVYQLVIKNNGPSNAADVVVNDPTPAGLTFVSNTGDCTTAFPCSFGILAPNQSKTIRATYSIPANFSGSSISNTASVSSPTADPQPNSNSASTTTPANPSADLSLSKIVDNNSPAIGETIAYTITLDNAGSSNAQGVEITDQLPATLQFVSSTPSLGTYNPSTGIWTIGTVPIGTQTLVINAKVLQPGAISNNAQVSASTTVDPDSTPNDGTGDDASSVSLTARAPDLSLAKAHTGNFVRGGTGTYNLTLSNSGNATTVGVSVISDTLPTGLTPNSASGIGWTCSITGQNVNCNRNDPLVAGSSYPVVNIVVAVAQNAASSLVNTANVSGGGEVNTSNNSATDPTSIVSSSDLSLVKTAPSSLVPGTNAVFSIVVTNSGTSDAQNVQVTDPTPSGLVFVANTGDCQTAFPCSLGTVAANSSRTISATYSVPANVVAASISNTATVSSSTPDPTPINTSTTTTPVTPSADLSLDKTAPSSVTPGSNVVYTIAIKNNGSSDAQNVSVTDPTPSGLTFVANTGDCITAFPCNLATVPAGTTRTISATYFLDPNFVPSTLTNSASLSSSTPDPSSSNNTDPASSPSTPSADLSLQKVLLGAVPNIGSNATFRITISNTGSSHAKNVIVKDQLPTGLSFISSNPSLGTYNSTTGEWSISNLGLGTQTLEIVATVTQAANLTNTAEITSSATPDPDSTPNDGTGDDRASVSLTPTAPDLSLSKTHVGNLVRGQPIVYTLAVSNSGNGATIAPVTVADTLPTGLSPIDASGSGWNCTISGQAISCTRADVLAAASAYPAISIEASILETAPDPLANTANTNGGGEVNTTNNSATDTSPVSSSSDLSILKTGAVTATPGTNFSYTLVISNNGPSAASNVVVTDPTPANTTFVANTGDCISAFPCQFASLASGQSRSITATYNLNPSTPNPTVISNSASLSSSTPDPSSNNNSSTAQTSVGAPVADLSLTKSDDPASSVAVPGTNITYKIVVGNAGPSNANAATVVDTFPSSISGVTWTCSTSSNNSSCPASGSGNINTPVNVAVGDTITFMATGLIAADAVGVLINNANVTPPIGTADPSGNNNGDSNTLVPEANLEIIKTAPSEIVPGTNASYTITVKNLGPSNAADVIVTDPTPSGMTFVGNTGACVTAFPCSLGIVPPNTSRTITATFAVPSGLTGNASNSASVSSSTNDPSSSNNTSTATLLVSPKADLSLTKTVSKTNPIVGENITYTITLSNLGASDANTIVAKDQLPVGLTLISSNPSLGVYNSSTGNWTIPTLSANSSATLSLVARVDQTGSTTNTASIISSGTPDPVANTPATATIGAVSPDLSLTKTHTGNFVRGSTGSYNLKVNNLGSSPSSAAVAVTDTIPLGLSPQSATGTGWNCSLNAQTVVCNRGDALPPASSYPDIILVVAVSQTAPNSLINSASVLGGGDTNPSNNNASDPTTVVSSSDLKIQKVADKTIANLGENIIYTITLSNLGSSNAENVVISENLPAQLQLVSSSASLGVYNGSTWTLPLVTPSTQTLSLVAKVIAAGNTTNTASLSSSDTPDPQANNNSASADVLTTAPDLSIAKIHTGDLVRGNTGIYEITVKNTGSGATTAPVIITDTLPLGLEPISASGTGWTCEAVAQTVTCTRADGLAANASYAPVFITVKAAQNAPSNLINRASVLGGGDSTSGNNTATDPTNIVSSADLSLVKIAPSSITPGLPAVFTLRVTNHGSSDAQNVVLTDPTPSGLTVLSVSGDCTALPCNLGTIPNGQTRSTEISYSVPSSYQTPNPISNTASLTSSTPDPDPSNSSASVLVPLLPSADLRLSKIGAVTAVAGTEITYTLRLENAGPSDAQNVVLTDPTPIGLTLVSVTGDCTAFPCNLGTLPSGGVRSAVVRYSIPSTYTTPDPIINRASVSSSTPDPSSSSNTAQASTTLNAPIADLSLVKTNGTTIAIPGATTTYTITAQNAGPSAAIGAQLTDTVPNQLENVTWTCRATAGSSCNQSSGTGSLDILVDLISGGTITVTLTARVKADATGLIINSASIIPPTGVSDPTSANNSDQDTVQPQADLQMQKIGPSNLVAGGTAIYTLSVSNAGPSNAASVLVTDPTPSGLVFVGNTGACSTAFPCNLGTIPPNTTRTINATYRVPSDFNAASVSNTASVSSSTTDPDKTNNARTVITPSNSSADLSLEKTINNSAPLPGDTVRFTIRLSNDGPSDARNMIVRERIPSGLNLVSITPTRGSYDPITANWTVPLLANGSSASLTVVAVVVGNGAIRNTAEIIGSDTPDPDSTPNDGLGDDFSSVVFGAPVANLSIVKTNNATALIPGTPVIYTITARNAGPANANGTEITDTMPSQLEDVTWTCVGNNAATCPASGTGNISAVVNLPANSSLVFTVKGTVNANATGILSNSARIKAPSGTNDPDTSDNSSTDTDALTPQADLEIIKTAPSNAARQSELPYTIVVKNLGSSLAKAVKIQDLKPAKVEFIRVSSNQGTCQFSLTGLECNLGDLAAGQSLTVTLIGKPDLIGESINTATVSSNTTDLISNNNTSSAKTLVGTLSDLELQKIPEGVFVVGAKGTYRFEVRNIGTATDNGGFTITDTLPNGLSYSSSTGLDWTCSAIAQTVTCTNPNRLEASRKLEDLRIIVDIAQAAYPAVTNTATVTSPIGDSRPSNNTTSAPTPVTAPVLVLEKIATQPIGQIGGRIGFTLRLQNNGNVPISNLQLLDLLPLGLLYQDGSSQLDGVSIKDPTKTTQNNRQNLIWDIGSIVANQTRVLTFSTNITPLVTIGELVNSASATGNAGALNVSVASNNAVAAFKITAGVFANKGIILGRVYFDNNDNNNFEINTDTPLEGARVYLSDGRYAITDSQGRYNFVELEAGTHAVRLDPLTAPYPVKPLPDMNGQPGTRLVHVQGGIEIEDFPLYPSRTAIQKTRDTKVERGPISLIKRATQGGAGYAIEITIKINAAIQNLEITDPTPNSAERGILEVTRDGKPLIATFENGIISLKGVHEPGEIRIRYALFTNILPENAVTDPSIRYEEVIR
jgi:uncharacterized repeat protein (TIGR01451 family)